MKKKIEEARKDYEKKREHLKEGESINQSDPSWCCDPIMVPLLLLFRYQAAQS